MIEVPDDLHPDCLPLAWLLGRWQGAGVGDYPTIEGFRFGQEVEFRHDARAFLAYESRSWLLDDDGALVRQAARETGWWRPQKGGREVEVLLTHPTGFVEIYTGTVEAAKIELVTGGVLRTETAKDYRAGRRLYGLVGSRLMWAYDMAAMGHELQPHLSAELIRTASATEVAGPRD